MVFVCVRSRERDFIPPDLNRVPRVLRLFGQWVGARRDSGDFEKI